MSSPLTHLFSDEELVTLSQLPEVVAARARVAAGSHMAYFSIPLTDPIREVLQDRLGLSLTTVSQIPMRWIQGDTAPHIDSGAHDFEHTYLVYLNDSPGEFILGSDAYPIRANTAFVFSEGLQHRTLNTGSEPRLLIGPMNELAEPLGLSTMYYYPSQADALTNTNEIGNVSSYTVGAGGPFGSYTHWRIASNSTGTSPQNAVYTNGQTLDATGTYYLYPGNPCFLEGTQVLCLKEGEEVFLPIESLKSGTLVKTRLSGYKRIEIIASGSIQNPGSDDRIADRLYKCSKQAYPELTEDLYLTGHHSILVDSITEKQKQGIIKHLGRVFVTDKKYRLIACVDERAEPWASEGTYTIWHIALENIDPNMNYGIYVNGGLLVETCCLNTLKNKSNLISI
jgi:hypothetical protein